MKKFIENSVDSVKFLAYNDSEAESLLRNLRSVMRNTKAGDKAQYDTRVKRLLAQKIILAHILVKTVDEFKGMKPEDVVKYIEGEPSISVVPVEPGLANMEKTDAAGQRIVGLNT